MWFQNGAINFLVRLQIWNGLLALRGWLFDSCIKITLYLRLMVGLETEWRCLASTWVVDTLRCTTVTVFPFLRLANALLIYSSLESQRSSSKALHVATSARVSEWWSTDSSNNDQFNILKVLRNGLWCLTSAAGCGREIFWLYY